MKIAEFKQKDALLIDRKLYVTFLFNTLREVETSQYLLWLTCCSKHDVRGLTSRRTEKADNVAPQNKLSPPRTSCEFRLTAEVFISRECAGLVQAMTWWNYKSHKRVVNLWNSWRSCFLKGRRGGGGGAAAYWQIHCLSHNKALLSYQTGALILLTHSAFKASLKILSFLSGALMAPNTKELINLQVSVLTMLRGKHFVWSFSRNNPWETTLGEKYLK